MTSFPIYERLDIDGYDMYPGTKQKPGLHVDFESGLTLVLGANGLGKTTLVNLLYRMSAGLQELPKLPANGELGGRKLVSARLSSKESRQFGERVADGALNATATLTFRLSGAVFVTTRSLDRLILRSLSVDGQNLDPTETVFQREILRHAGLPTFGDWILLLRHLVFYFEDRRALVWDPSAQRQIIRLLFLKSDDARHWARLERDVLELDSRMRNLQAVMNREQHAWAKNLAATEDSDGIRAELRALEILQEVDHERRVTVNDNLQDLEIEQQHARLAMLKAQADHESAHRELEGLQLVAISSALPSSATSARYILAQLFSNSECLTCGSEAPAAAELLLDRIKSDQCVVCGSEVAGEKKPIRFTPRKIAKATQRLDQLAAQLEASQQKLREVDEAHASAFDAAQALSSECAIRAQRINALVRSLPPEETEIHSQRESLASLSVRVEAMKRELAGNRQEFAEFISRINGEIVERSEEIKHTFHDFADGFLLEKCRLVWAPHKDTLGESGRQISYPAFDLEMGGAGFSSPVRRTGPNQVSESQREFIDLAFRMTLMSVAGMGNCGSLVIDAPESSLDAVFVRRAADVLIKFAKSAPENRLVVTSNLVEGDLIPYLIRRSGITSQKDRRVVDLLRIAAPTAATSSLGDEYAEVRSELFRRAEDELE